MALLEEHYHLQNCAALLENVFVFLDFAQLEAKILKCGELSGEPDFELSPTKPLMARQVEPGISAEHAEVIVDSMQVRTALQHILAADLHAVLEEACRIQGLSGRLQEILVRLREPTSNISNGDKSLGNSPPTAAVDDAHRLGVTAAEGAGAHATVPMWRRLDRQGEAIDWESRLQMCFTCQTEKATWEFSSKMLKKLRRKGLASEACCSECMQFTRAHKSDAAQKRHVTLAMDFADGSRKNVGLPDYLDKVFGKSCFPRLIQLKLFPGAKDVSEAYGALHAVWQHFPVASPEARVVCVSVGDGSTPRAAGLGAFLTQWHCIAVDPGLRSEWTGDEPQGVHRLTGLCSKIEDVAGDGWKSATAPIFQNMGVPEALVLVAIHSHHRFLRNASVPALRFALGAENLPTCLVSIPCCFPFRDVEDLGRRPDVCFDDWAILSDKREVRMWFWDADVAVTSVTKQK